MNEVLMFLPFFATAIVCYRAGMVTGYWKGYATKRGDEQDHPMIFPKAPRGPYPKPNGKRAPKVNDEAAAWRKENESNSLR